MSQSYYLVEQRGEVERGPRVGYMRYDWRISLDEQVTQTSLFLALQAKLGPALVDELFDDKGVARSTCVVAQGFAGQILLVCIGRSGRE